MDVHFPSDAVPSIVTARKCTDGSFVLKDAVILEYRPDGAPISTPVTKLRSPSDGVVIFRAGTKRGERLGPGVTVCEIADCEHKIVMKDMCATCGLNLREENGRTGQRTVATDATVSMVHNIPELHLAQTFGNSDREHCLAARKLVLLVDLDQTVIHTTNKKPLFDVSKFSDISEFHLYGGSHWTKLRPYTRQFFENLAPLFEMHIVTFGQRHYAHKIAEIIEAVSPTDRKRFFEHRILSRDESLSQSHKTRNLKALFPAGDEMVAIIDDRPDVWEFSHALVQLRPYKFFPDVDDINAPPGSSRQGEARREETRRLTGEEEPPEGEEDKAEEEEKTDDKAKVYKEAAPTENDDALKHVERVLRRVHDKFYSNYDNTGGKIRDLKGIIRSMRAEVLHGCVIVLSGVVPIGMKPERSDAYRVAVQFGATVSDIVTNDTTHVVAARWGSRKVHEAERIGIPIVRPEWLYACLERWQKVNEKEYLLTAQSANPVGAALGSSLVPDLANIPTIGQDILNSMTNEVDEALSDEGDDDGEEGEGAEEEDEEEAEDPGERERKARVVEVASRQRRLSEAMEKKRKLCPEARDRSYTGGGEEDDDDDFDAPLGRKRPRDEEEEGDEGAEADYGDDGDEDVNDDDVAELENLLDQ